MRSAGITDRVIGVHGHARIAGSPLSRRRFLGCAATGAVALATRPTLPERLGEHHVQMVHKAGKLEAWSLSDGHFFLPTDSCSRRTPPTAERDAVLKAAPPSRRSTPASQQRRRDQIASDLILVDAGAGPRHQPTRASSPSISRPLESSPRPSPWWCSRMAIPTTCGACSTPRQAHLSERYLCDRRARMGPLVRSTCDGDTPAVVANDRIVGGASNRLARIKDKDRRVRGGDEITSGVRVLETRGHTPGHISLELVGGRRSRHRCGRAYPPPRLLPASVVEGAGGP